MNNNITEKAESYALLNDIALKGEIVIFGSAYMADFPFYELVNKFRVEHAVYNRSIDTMTAAQACSVFEKCVAGLMPKKLFLSFGDTEHNSKETESGLLSLINTARSCLPHTQIYFLGIPCGVSKEINQTIKDVCRTTGITYVGLTSNDSVSNFRQMMCFFHTAHMSMADAFELADMQ